jgi:hypothetical protein
MCHFIAVLVFTGAVLSPAAEPVPIFDVASSCRAAAKIARAEAQDLNSCLQEEAPARQQLSRSWQPFAPAVRINCTAEASAGGSASDVELLT